MKREVDFIIVGQGIAGSVLSYELVKRDLSVCCIDNHHHRSSSLVSAGIINPITGRRFAYSWRYHEVMKAAHTSYDEMAHFFGRELLLPKNIYRYIPTIEAQNDLDAKFSDVFFQGLINRVDGEAIPAMVDATDYVRINGYMLDVRALISLIGQWLEKSAMLVRDEFDFADLSLGGDAVFYENIKARAIIFAEGIQVIYNPFFSKIPIVPYKGQVLIGEIADLNLIDILKRKYFLTQLPNGKMWFGSSDNMELMNFEATKSAEKQLKEGIRDNYNLDFDQYDVKVAVRPTSHDRRPVIGRHPKFQNVYILNGLGTKGASLAPYCTEKLLDFIINRGSLDETLDVNRYKFKSVF